MASSDFMSESNVPVLIVGGGPAGLITSLQLARHGIKSTLVERNLDTTKWPKMDITNCRSMELFRRLGIAEGLREQGVAQDFSFNVLFSTGLTEGGELICQWDLPSPNEWRERIHQKNDGSMPREPYQRCSQALFEAWLKPRIEAEPLIDARFGTKFESLQETEDGVEAVVVNIATGEKHKINCQYLVGCDGAGSRVRKAIGSTMLGGPVPMAAFLVHFKSKDLSALHNQGQFWHIFFSHGGVIISQDEVDTWTTHLMISPDTDWESLDPEAAIQTVLGGNIAPYPIKIDQILVKSAWRPNICIADKFTSTGGRIFLTGDAAHQNIPTGGYGMNTAVGDSFDIGWKIAAVLKEYGGKHLLSSYEIERKPVAARNIEHSGVHMKVHFDYTSWIRESGGNMVTSKGEEGQKLREKVRKHIMTYDGENKDHGIELGYRNENSPVIVPDKIATMPEWTVRDYIPSTWPGARAPHVYLTDDKTSIFDLFGPDFTLIDFSPDKRWIQKFFGVAAELKIPLKCVHLPDESHVASIWERQAVLVRPDDHVAWRSPPSDTETSINITEVLAIVTGRQLPPEFLMDGDGTDGETAVQSTDVVSSRIRTKGFTGTVGNQDRDQVALLAEFQK